MRRTLLCTLPLFALFLLAGCGSGGSTVSGTVNYGTTKMGPEDKLTVTMSDGKNTYAAEVDSGGNFKFNDVLPGSYTVTVTQYKVMPTTGGDAKPGSKPGGPGAPDMKTYPESFKAPGGPYTIEMSKITPTKK